MSYWFAVFAATFFILYYCFPASSIRRALILLSGVVFQIHFASPAGSIPIFLLGLLTYIAGISRNRIFIKVAIATCVTALVFYKYTMFLTAEMLGILNPELTAQVATLLERSVLPAAPPLGISFFIFEFVHYLMDVLRGERPLRSIADFGLFALFWTSMVAGPIKRYEQFIPSLRTGVSRIHMDDFMVGMIRVAIGLLKKFIADNLTSMIDFYVPNFDTASMEIRWLIFAGISLRILLDFSGYSDIAIGFAKMMGIKLPENFKWPYIATGPIDFWHRWHISLSTWIRDYVYIPLGGGRKGLPRKIANSLIAFALCGLWHGAGWNFVIWGLYHGAGLALNNLWRARRAHIKLPSGRVPQMLFLSISRLATLMFVMTGWLYFFFPVSKATHMLMLLAGIK